MKSTHWITTLCVIATASLLTACGGQGASPGAVDKDMEKSNNGPVELTVYSAGGEPEESWNANFGNAIKKKFPNYKINYINPRGNANLKIDALLTSGTTVDIYYESIGGFFSSMSTYQLQYDLTDLIKKYKVDLNRFEPSLIDAMKNNVKGQIWGLPVQNINMVLYYNKDVFDKFGIAYPKDGMTWDEALTLAKKFNRTEGGKQYTGLVVSPAHMIKMNPYSLPLVDPASEQATINKDAKWKALYQTLFADVASDETYRAKIASLNNKLPYIDQFYKNYDLAMFAGLSSLFTSFAEFESLNWDIVSLPTFKDLPKTGSQSYPTYFSVTSSSKYKEEAFQVINYLTSDEVQLDISKKGLMSSLKGEQFKSNYAKDAKFKNKNFQALFYNQLAPIPAKTVYDTIAEKAYQKQLVDLSLGKVDINTMFRAAEEETNKGIASQKGK
ncbi:ABC transporter substrate-binding protein [Paenibacillus allorhizosphaerae]|uniref:Extracellular solute-binding protein n=1 Tax=Paenibacillus allorhizosphaerae TaxID=2849866 RepID=A0ABN7TJ22_9BACL|nr:extracellular solute-binding protein [Paenibacillus allorhizosphaerae]CAG7635540.1 hypothetical protein PAECIP111802_02152 [Paenibacillus allorhizosphaerae]